MGFQSGELLNAIKDMPRGKVPKEDEPPPEFHQSFSEMLPCRLSVNIEARECGELPWSMK